MAAQKIAISLPEEVLFQVDRLAKRTHTTRSGCIARVMAEVARASTQAEITERINFLFNDPRTVKEQRTTAKAYLRASDEGLGDSEW